MGGSGGARLELIKPVAVCNTGFATGMDFINSVGFGDVGDVEDEVEVVDKVEDGVGEGWGG